VGYKKQGSSAFGELLALLFQPVLWLVRLVVGRKAASQDEIKRFYRSAEWKRLRFEQLSKSPVCKLCGASAASGARMNVDHVRPLHRFWHLRLQPSNLQTLCASCNWGKGGR
jgi:5-methylcytosine-specific restriction endonuclease McrA